MTDADGWIVVEWWDDGGHIMHVPWACRKCIPISTDYTFQLGLTLLRSLQFFFVLLELRPTSSRWLLHTAPHAKFCVKRVLSTASLHLYSCAALTPLSLSHTHTPSLLRFHQFSSLKEFRVQIDWPRQRTSLFRQDRLDSKEWNGNCFKFEKNFNSNKSTLRVGDGYQISRYLLTNHLQDMSRPIQLQFGRVKHL